MYMQWSKEDDSTSSSGTLSIPLLPCLEKLYLLQLKLYIEAQTMTQYFVCRICKNTVLIRYAEVKENVFCIL